MYILYIKTYKIYYRVCLFAIISAFLFVLVLYLPLWKLNATDEPLIGTFSNNLEIIEFFRFILLYIIKNSIIAFKIYIYIYIKEKSNKDVAVSYGVYHLETVMGKDYKFYVTPLEKK